MSLKVKTKLYIGLGLLAGLVILLWVSGSVFINTLALNSGTIIKDNIRTLTYAQQMEQALNDLYVAQIKSLSNPNPDQILNQELYQRSIDQFKLKLDKQEENLTESGEQELTNQVRSDFETLTRTFRELIQSAELTPNTFDSRLIPVYIRLQHKLGQLTNMNLDAIHRKNDTAQNTASNVTIYMSIIGLLCSLLALVMLFKFPGYIVSPIQKLIERIKDITDRKYDRKLEFKTGDEYEALAKAFNQMARKLQEYESSNLSQIMSEKQRVEAIINHMNDAVIGLDADKKILFLNDKATQLIGAEKSSIVGKYAPDLATSSDFIHKVIKNLNLNERSEDEEQDDSDFIKYDEDGNRIYFSREIIPIHFNKKNGTPDEISYLGAIITLKNVTHFHEIYKAKSDFIEVISHELKTPISSIDMSLRLLEDKRIGQLNEEQKELIKNIRKDIGRMKQTSRELLDISKIETGNIQLNVSESHPVDLIEYAYETMVMQAARKNVEMEIVVEELLPDVKADIQKTVWVLINLISNALRYTEANDHITLKAGSDNKFVQFSVTDTGQGIEPEYIDKIFQKYFQIDKDRKDNSGSGLGLAIAKEFINAQGGKIWVESNPGSGSIFYFTLPKA